MKPFKSSPLKLVTSTDPDLCRIACPLCESDTVTLLIQKAMAVTGPIDHGSKGPIAGNVLSIPGVCPEGHHFIVRFANHNGVGLTWLDMPTEADQEAMSESVQAQAKLETFNMPHPLEDQEEANIGCGDNMCPDCGGQIPKQKAPDMGNGCCPVGINIAKAISALAAGNCDIKCLKCPILGCPGNPRNGGESHTAENVVPGCPWSVEHYAVMQGWEKGEDLLICSACPHTSCEVHPDHDEAEPPADVYNQSHYKAVDKKIVDKTKPSNGDPIGAIKKAATPPAKPPVVHLTSPIQSSTFAMFKVPQISPQDLAMMKARLENLLASDITEGERKWATRLLTIVQHPSAASSIELHESIEKMKKIRKQAGMAEPPADVIPAPVSPAPKPPVVQPPATMASLVGALKQIAKDAGQPLEQQANTRQMEIEQYVELLRTVIQAEASIGEKTEAKKSCMSLVALLIYKRNTVPGSVSVALSTLLDKLAMAESLAKQYPKCLVLTDLMPKPSPMIGHKGPNSLEVPFSKLNPHLNLKPNPKKKKP